MYQFAIHHVVKATAPNRTHVHVIGAMNWERMVFAFQNVQMAVIMENVLHRNDANADQDTFYKIRFAHRFVKSKRFHSLTALLFHIPFYYGNFDSKTLFDWLEVASMVYVLVLIVVRVAMDMRLTTLAQNAKWNVIDLVSMVISFMFYTLLRHITRWFVWLIELRMNKKNTILSLNRSL